MVPGKKIDVSFFASGYCVAQARAVNPRANWAMTRFYAVWALIKHPEIGILLFDGGYNLSFYSATRRWPDRLYRWVTPVVVNRDETAVSILEREHIHPEEVNYFAISHFHADHICALKDFPQARFICSQKAYNEVQGSNGLAAVRKGILKHLIPNDFEKRLLFLEDISTPYVDQQSRLTFFCPFDQDSLQFVDLPGHARGMFGFYVRDRGAEMLYGADASWGRDVFLDEILPSPAVRLFIDSWSDYKETNKRLLLFLRNKPLTKILFTHCPQTLKYIMPPI